MRAGLWILCGFAVGWCSGGIYFAHLPWWWIMLPIAMSAAILFWARRMPGAADGGGAHVGRLVAIWSSVEGVAMFVAANLLINLNMIDKLLPALAIIVGLHFLPLARGIPVRSYYATSAGLIAAGLVGWLLPASYGPSATALAGALVLWASAIALAKRGGA